jgi:hypothetical protein
MKTTLFKKINDNFIETGSYIGDGIQLALNSGFSKVYSIELSDYYYKICQSRFCNLQNKVTLINGDSYFKLKELLEQEKNTNFTFWLDGHYSGGNTAFGVKEFPIMEELQTILERHMNNEIIYVDDMRILRNYDDKINTKNIIDLVKKYKPNCNINFESSIYDPEDILKIEY